MKNQSIFHIIGAYSKLKGNALKTVLKNETTQTVYDDPYGGLPFLTFGVRLGKEKHSRIDARIFPNPCYVSLKRTKALTA